MNKRYVWLGLLAVILLFSATSCGKRQHLSISKTELSFNDAGGIDFFQITANCDWSVSTDINWLTVNPSSGNGDCLITVTAEKNKNTVGREGVLTVTTTKGLKFVIKVTQTKADINHLVQKVWFTRTNERWDTDYFNDYIPESYRLWTYYNDPGSENWFWYFIDDQTSYQIHTKEYDTVYYPFEYVYYPEGDSLYVNFITTDNSVEDYHATINQLDEKNFIITYAYRPHQFEKITSINVTGDRRGMFKINPKKVANKPAGPLITVHR